MLVHGIVGTPYSNGTWYYHPPSGVHEQNLRRHQGHHMRTVVYLVYDTFCAHRSKFLPVLSVGVYSTTAPCTPYNWLPGMSMEPMASRLGASNARVMTAVDTIAAGGILVSKTWSGRRQSESISLFPALLRYGGVNGEGYLDRVALTPSTIRVTLPPAQ